MKKVVLLILGIMIFSSINVNALECTDYLTYVTTQDTEARAGSMSASPTEIYLEEGTTFKECYISNVGIKVVLSNGEYADSVRSGTYKLKEKFDIKKAHKVDKTDYEVCSDGTFVYSDPTPIKKIGMIGGESKVKASYYYGPYVYVTDGFIEGWVYDQDLIELKENENQVDDTDSYISSDTENSDIEEPIIEKEEAPNSKWIVICSSISLLLIITIISIIIVRKKRSKKVSQLQ